MNDTKSHHFSTIDILKGVAIWMVILVHSRQTFQNLAPWLKVFDIGQMGCQIFFVISGLSTMMSFERLELQEHSLRKFYKKRLMAIIPGWYTAIFFVYILNSISLILDGDTIGFAVNRQPLSILCNLLLIHGFLPFCNNDVYAGGWFVGTIAIFYLIAPFIYKFLRQNKRVPIRYIPWIAQTIACIVIIGIYLLKDDMTLAKYGFAYFSFVNQIGCFLLGTILYVKLKDYETLKDNLYLRKILCVVYLVLLFYMFFSKWIYFSVLVSFTMGLFTYNLLICMISTEIRTRHVFEKSVIWNILKNYGLHSYYIYLIHFLFVWTIPFKLQKIFLILDVQIDDNIVYSIWIIPIFVFSYYAALLFEKIVVTIQSSLRKLCSSFRIYKT